VWLFVAIEGEMAEDDDELRRKGLEWGIII